MITPVIMAGGSGTRLWPLSRAGHPKQFLALNGDKTMLQQTVERLADLPTSESITICNEEHRFFVAEQLREINTLGSTIREFVSRPVAKHCITSIALKMRVSRYSVNGIIFINDRALLAGILLEVSMLVCSKVTSWPFFYTDNNG